MDFVSELKVFNRFLTSAQSDLMHVSLKLLLNAFSVKIIKYVECQSLSVETNALILKFLFFFKSALAQVKLRLYEVSPNTIANGNLFVSMAFLTKTDRLFLAP